MSGGSIRLQFRLVPRVVAVIITVAATALLAFGRGQAAEEADDISLETTRQELTAIQQAVARARTERRLLDLREETLAIQSKLQGESARLTPQLDQIEARIAQLGAAPQGAKEPEDVASQRRELERERASLEGQIKLAGLLSLEADQTVTLISARSREQFRQRVGNRTKSPLAPAFWADLGAELPNDLRRVRAFATEVKQALQDSHVVTWIGAVLATGITLAARDWLTRKVRSFAPPGRLRRTLRALTHVLFGTLSASLIVSAVMLALSFGDEQAPHLAALLPGIGLTVTFGVYVAALGAALLSARAPSWRLPPISDEVAIKLRGYSVQLAVVIILVSLVEQFADAIDVSPGMSVALDGLMTLVLAVTLASGLRRGVHAQIAGSRESSGNEAAPAKAALPLWLAIVVGIGWILLVGGALCVLPGYIALGSFIVKQTVWTLIVLCTAYLITVVIEDVLMALLTAGRSRLSHQATKTQHATKSARTPTAVLFSALVRFTVGLSAAVLLFAPYGAGAIDLLPKFHRVQEGISIGAIHLRPGAVIRGILILVLGLGAVRAVKQWTEKRYLPVTRMDAAMRATITSLVGYAGYVIVIAFALSAMGVGLQQIAWVGSALALGIGFGLQAIVQNFVSGLILLAERPIKVGDWVVLNEFEGDVRNIRARATEIQKRDRSTIIVPNSEFITKVVRNITYANPLGLVEIRLPMPLGTEVERVRTELLETFRAHPEILRKPAPYILLEGIDGGSILFIARGFVMSPRSVEDIRSAMLFDALVRLNAAGITLTRTTAVVMKPGVSVDERA